MYNSIMNKNIFVCVSVMAILLCGCQAVKSESQTRFVLDTVATLTADCDKKTLDGAFDLCLSYEDLLSKTVATSDVTKLNNATDFCEVSPDTKTVIEKAIYYCKLSGGRYDITVYPLTSVWDFKNQIVPNKDEIAEALKNVDYESIEIDKNRINLNGKKIDLGSIAKGYIADKMTDYLKKQGAKTGIVNLGGNVVVFGREYNVGIMKPFTEENAAVIHIKDKSVVTSGIYQRYIKKDGKIYHHVLDTKTGYGVENDLAGVTVIGGSSADCDALSTVLLLLGKDEGLKTVNGIENFEAVFITRDGKISLSKGLYYDKDNFIQLK